MDSIQLVVFDIAGTTLYDGDTVLQAFEATLKPRKIVVPRDRLNAVMGLPKRDAIRQLLAERNEVGHSELVDHLHDEFVQRMKQYYAGSAEVREIPGAGMVFATLRQRGFKLALNTGFSREIVEVILPRLGWSVPETIDAVISSDEVPRGRPGPDMIQRLMARFGIRDARQVAKVGDTVADLQEGFNSGCGLNIAVLTGAATQPELLEQPHTHILPSVCEVLTLAELQSR